MFKTKKRIFLFAILIILSVVSVSLFSTVPDLSVEKITEISETLTIYDNENNVSALLDGGQRRKSISIKNVPEHVINALIAVEDIRFYEHNGIDIKRIFGALFNDIKAGNLKEGGSTITQQLIKNSHLSNDKKFSRKIYEAILALQLERQYDKDEILEMYLNFVYFGRGAYGIQAASEAYFGINVEELTVSQGATLIGILKAPSRYAPHINMDNAIKRRNTVLMQMKKYGFISEEQCINCTNEDITVIEKSILPDYGYYTDYVLNESAECLNITVDELLAGGYNIYTSLDPFLQKELQEIYENKDNFPDEKVQSASVIIDNNSGAISALIGGREHSGMRIYNRVTARRQPGSTIKPLLVYGPAFENKSITPSTVLDDYRKEFSGYMPTNYKDVYYGKVTVREALSLSLNVPAVELLLKNGIEYSKEYAQKTGIKFDEDDKYLALALGGMKYGVTPIEIAGAYSMLACNGEYKEPYCVKKITDSNGKTLYEHKAEKKRVFSESTAFLLTDILKDVSKQENNGHIALSGKIATKTGTVGYSEKGHSDAWSVGYDKTHTVSVWMGYDVTTNEQYLPYEVTGSAQPSKISAQIFNKIIEKYGYKEFVQPESVVKLKIDGYSLKSTQETFLANENQSDTFYEYYAKDNAPQITNSYWDKPQLPIDIRLQYNELRQAEISFSALNDFTEYYIIKKNQYGEKIVSTLKGNKNQKLIFVDDEYFSGDSYIIQPIHADILIDSKPLLGEKSREYTLY